MEFPYGLCILKVLEILLSGLIKRHFVIIFLKTVRIILKVVRIFLKGVRIFVKTPKSHIVRIFVPPQIIVPDKNHFKS